MAEGGVKVQLAVRALKGLAEPTRLRLLALLGHGELTVGEVCRVLGQSQPRVSRHLRLLTEAGFLDRFREQQCVYYRTPATGARSRWVHELLAAIDPEDAALRRDRVRLSNVIGDRGRVAAGELAGTVPADPEDLGLSALLRDVLGPVAVGELLDIGTGTGRMLEMLGPLARHAVGIDLSAPALRLARARVHGRGFAHCEFHRGDMYALPFESGAFDTVTIAHVLAGAERPAEVLGEAARALRKSGRLVVVERFDDIEACSGANPLHSLRQWLELGGLHLARLWPCDLASGHHLLALAHRAH
ncbi:MAG TPA: metalloregulator ArsR/SmtB family transcription factor [Steroidobacteraceae bacterium]|nr:metalloregulator ArsR/SmtB family transcription factor [Steroidobacteraceae bacterium]